jgi:DNA modification methylase
MADRQKQANMFDKPENGRTRTSAVTQKSLLEKDVPQMPEGYYSGDKPNFNLTDFIDRYGNNNCQGHIDEKVEKLMTSRGGALGSTIYDQHSYWSKKPYGGIEYYINHFSKENDLILDPFCGSGSTIIVAASLGRNIIGIDISPSATFISAGYVLQFDVDKVLQVGEEIYSKLIKRYNDAYIVDNREIKAFIISDTCRCPRCYTEIAIYNLINDTTSSDTYCPNCKYEKISTRSKKIQWIGQKIVDTIPRLNDIKQLPDILYNTEQAEYIRNTSLNVKIPNDISHMGRLSTLSIDTVGKLYSDRSIILLDALKQEILLQPNEIKMPLLFIFSSILLNASKMYRVREGGGGGPAGNYFVPSIRRDNNPLILFIDKLHGVVSAKIDWNKYKLGKFILSTQSATNLYNIPSNSIDYIFTDPPYSGIMPYGSLNTVWEAWLNFNRDWLSNEIINEKWHVGMYHAVSEMFRVLKYNSYLTLCYHDTSEGTWGLINDIFSEIGFLIDNSSDNLHIDTPQRPMQQVIADKVIKRDLVINFRKPKPGEIAASVSLTGQEDAATFADKVRRIIRDYLDVNPGSTKDRVYDEVVSRMVRSGQMEAHDFDALLRQVADEISVEGEKGPGRWYLKEAELTTADAAETAREDNAAAKLESFIWNYFQKRYPGRAALCGTMECGVGRLGDTGIYTNEGVHYSDLFEHYIYAVKDKPRRHLADILPDYFYKTDDGTWRLPASDEERAAKANARSAGLGRRVKRYIALLEAGAAIPEHERQSDATLAEWLRYCKRAGLFAQGKLLYEKGGLNTDNLPEEAMVGVEEDYQACVLMLNRESSAPKKRGPGKK